jgi:hypothetical protein
MKSVSQRGKRMARGLPGIASGIGIDLIQEDA